VHPFIQKDPSLDSIWRAIILFGRNVASYKFALAKSLFEVADRGQTSVKIELLAEPFARHVCDHLKIENRQGISGSSKFLDACRAFNTGKINHDQLVTVTVRHGFQNVIDAFHIVNQGETPVRFFQDDRKASDTIVLTDDLFRLKELPHSENLLVEVESRWRLVETAWGMNIASSVLTVSYDPSVGGLFVASRQRGRIGVTSCRGALNGYQRGRCFYCGDLLRIGDSSDGAATHVDHFFPFMLTRSNEFQRTNLNGVWNLVLSCNSCNGPSGKWARVPSLQLLSRLERRNNYLIDSHHPLRETLIAQTGRTANERRHFLQATWNASKERLIHEWEPSESILGL
jgi:hypothetical protein